jgi:hypothetical protein
LNFVNLAIIKEIYKYEKKKWIERRFYTITSKLFLDAAEMRYKVFMMEN